MTIILSNSTMISIMTIFIMFLYSTKIHLNYIFLHISQQFSINFLCFPFNYSHALHLNRQLVKVSRKKKGIYQLKFRKTVSINGKIKFCYVYSRYVIRSILKGSMLNIQMPQLSTPQFLFALNSVSDVPAYQWWLGGSYNFTYTHSDLPCRQSYNWGIAQTGKAVILISYTYTSSEVAFWRRLQNVGNTISKRFDETRVTDGVVKHVHLHLSKVYNRHVKTFPCPIDGMTFIWKKYPYNGGWVKWKPGSKWYNIKRYLTRPFPREDIYINHGYWGGEYNAWAEGSYFNVPSYLKTNDLQFTKKISEV